MAFLHSIYAKNSFQKRIRLQRYEYLYETYKDSVPSVALKAVNGSREEAEGRRSEVVLQANFLQFNNMSDEELEAYRVKVVENLNTMRLEVKDGETPKSRIKRVAGDSEPGTEA